MDAINPAQAQRLNTEANIWLATTRRDGHPHLVPIWFVWWEAKFYILTATDSVKAHNLRRNPHASVALEDGIHPLIAECTARSVSRPYATRVQELFRQKYDWDINNAGQYDAMFELAPVKWLSWES